MRTPDRILFAVALGLLSGLSAAWGFEGNATRSQDVTPSAVAPQGGIPRAVQVDVPRPPAPIPRATAPASVPIPNAALPRPTAPVPALAAPAAPPLDRPVPPPTAFAAPTAPI